MSIKITADSPEEAYHLFVEKIEGLGNCSLSGEPRVWDPETGEECEIAP